MAPPVAQPVAQPIVQPVAQPVAQPMAQFGPDSGQRTVLVCQNRACRKAGAAAVLAKFQHLISESGHNSTADPGTADPDPTSDIPVDLPSSAVNPLNLAQSVIDITVLSCQCLGQCGNGPMVLIMPEQVWYHRVHSSEVPAIVQQHLQQGKWLKGLLYPKFHGR
jgi:(2Fe-2S) ferredoxin